MPAHIKKLILITFSVMVMSASQANPDQEQTCEMDIEKNGIGTQVISVGIDYLSQIFTDNDNCWLKNSLPKNPLTETVHDIALKYIF